VHRYGLVAIGEDGREDDEHWGEIARASRKPAHCRGFRIVEVNRSVEKALCVVFGTAGYPRKETQEEC
jgi:hypothetical protein